jgi:hypothetical protein
VATTTPRSTRRRESGASAWSPRATSRGRRLWPRRQRCWPPATSPWSAGTVHSVRLPSAVVSTEVVFGLPDDRLLIRDDAADRRRPTSPERCPRPEGGPFRADARARRASARPGLTLPERLGRFDRSRRGEMAGVALEESGIDGTCAEHFVTGRKAAWNSHRPVPFVELMTDEIVYDEPARPTTTPGPGDVRALVDSLWRAFSDPRVPDDRRPVPPTRRPQGRCVPARGRSARRASASRLARGEAHAAARRGMRARSRVRR